MQIFYAKALTATGNSINVTVEYVPDEGEWHFTLTRTRGDSGTENTNVWTQTTETGAYYAFEDIFKDMLAKLT